jgi:uncharacterized membrane protein
MEFLADTWILWLIISVICLLGMIFYRQNRRGIITTFTSAEDFSVRTIFFSLRKGEAMVSFSLFLAGLVRWVRTILD